MLSGLVKCWRARKTTAPATRNCVSSRSNSRPAPCAAKDIQIVLLSLLESEPSTAKNCCKLSRVKRAGHSLLQRLCDGRRSCKSGCSFWLAHVLAKRRWKKELSAVRPGLSRFARFWSGPSAKSESLEKCLGDLNKSVDNRLFNYPITQFHNYSISLGAKGLLLQLAG